jgi:hypothetical protein
MPNGDVILSVGTLLKDEEVKVDSEYLYQEYFYLNYVNHLEEGDQYYWEV